MSNRYLELLILALAALFAPVVHAHDRDNTLALRNRIENGDVRGPRILTVGLPLFPPDGLPIYIAHLPNELLDKLPQPRSVDEALAALRENFAAGTDGSKLFIATPQGDNTIKRMSAGIVGAAVNETRRQAKLLFAHQRTFRECGKPLTLTSTSSLIRRSERLPLARPADEASAGCPDVDDTDAQVVRARQYCRLWPSLSTMPPTEIWRGVASFANCQM